MRIAVDVMGGDHGGGVVIAGAKRALDADKKITTLYLVGNKSDIHASLPPGGFRDHRVRVIHASEVLAMEDKPASAVRKKKDSSIVRAVELVHDHKADAVVSVGKGNTFGHPRFEVITRIAAAGTRLYRTDEFGLTTFLLSRDGTIREASDLGN